MFCMNLVFLRNYDCAPVTYSNAVVVNGMPTDDICFYFGTAVPQIIVPTVMAVSLLLAVLILFYCRRRGP